MAASREHVPYHTATLMLGTELWFVSTGVIFLSVDFTAQKELKSCVELDQLKVLGALNIELILILSTYVDLAVPVWMTACQLSTFGYHY